MRIFFTSILLCYISSSLWALDAGFSFATFKGKEEKNYVELSFEFLAPSVKFVLLEDSSYQAGVEIVILFKQADKIIQFDKYILNSPKVSKELIKLSDFINVKRYFLKNGTYTLDITLKDINQADNSQHFEREILMDYDEGKVAISAIQLLASCKESNEVGHPLVKNGYYLEPYPFNFYPRNYDKLLFYCETYNTSNNTEKGFFLRYYIEDFESKDVKVIGHKRGNSKDINAFVLPMDIKKLASGNYNLVVELRSDKNELLVKKAQFIQRSNPYLEVTAKTYATVATEGTFVEKLSVEDLKFNLESFVPRANTYELNSIEKVIKQKDVEGQRKLLLSLWAKEDPGSPYKAFSKYRQSVNVVEKNFASAIDNGYETDRGRIYLKYGAPNEIVKEESEPDAPPYEVWTYNNFSNQQAYVKFIFYNPSLAVNDFVLLHSTARNELSDPQWQRKLYRNAPQKNGNYIDDTDVPNNYGRQARRIFGDQ